MSPRPSTRRGFTLIELVVVCLIIGILASFAVPQYLKSVEMSKADDAVAMVNMIGTTNRMFALDHSGHYVSGQFTSASCPVGTCPASVTDTQTAACTLVWCNYLADQDWAKKPYDFEASDNSASSCVLLPERNNSVSCAKRKNGATPGTDLTPYSTWGFSMSGNGAISAYGTTPPPPVY